VDGLSKQAAHCAANGAPITAAVVRAQISLFDPPSTKVGHCLASWPGDALEDALGLRLAGGLHHLHLSGREPLLNGLYAGQEKDVSGLVASVVAAHDEALLPWLASPPQTNEAGRSAAVMAALLCLAREEKDVAQFELREIGASAGVNTNMAHYRYRLGDVLVGKTDSSLEIVPEWRGPSPLDPEILSEIRISNSIGCDQNPLDLNDEDILLRLKAFVWADAPHRLTTLDRAAQIAKSNPPIVQKMDAADFVDREFNSLVPRGTMRILFHTIVWQYLPESTRNRILASVRASAARGNCVGIIAVETNRETMAHEVSVRHWPQGNEVTRLLGTVHAHGKWVQWN
jgi:hypothetical protein